MSVKSSRSDIQFDFGRNWSDFSRGVDETHVAKAVAALQRLLGYSLSGKTILDIGSGSGLAAVAALRLGAAQILAIDIDEQSVSTTRAMLQRFAPQGSWTVRQASALALGEGSWPLFDVVYSWGVLHHTGHLEQALRCAAQRVSRGGTLALALYRRTPLDRFWIAEKRLYSRAPGAIRTIIRTSFKAAYLTAVTATGRSPMQYMRAYAERGMSWSHDIDDWLGGYPYEPMDSAEVTEILNGLGFVPELIVDRPLRIRGIFGAPCNEYRFVRRANQ